MELFPGFSCHVSTNPRSHVCTIFQFCVSNPRSYDGMWKSLKVTPQRNQPGVSHFIQTTEDSVCCLSFTRGTVKQMARHQHGSKMNWVSGWVLTCLRTSECMWEFMYTVQFVRWGEEELLLQVAVDFEAVVARIRNHDMSVGGESESLRAVQRVCWGVDVGEEGAAAIEHLGYKQKKLHHPFHLQFLALCLQGVHTVD